MVGKNWPFFMALPIVLVPIAGKTVRQLVVRPDSIQLPLEARINRFLSEGSELRLAFDNTKFEFGWLLYLVAPLFIACVTAIYFANPKRSQTNDRYYSAWSLIVASWIFFCLNFAFFEYPWPWQEWTGRTANGLIFTICLMSLTLAAIWKLWANRRAASETGDTTS